MNAWWQSLTLAAQVFYAIGILSGIFLVLQIMLTIFGFDHHDVTDAVANHPDGLGILSLRTITGFFFGFGWSGVICIQSGLGLFASLVVALATGAFFLVGLYLLMRGLFALRASGTLDYRNAVGQTATVYVSIPGRLSGSGQVEVVVQGRLATVTAMTPHKSPLPPGVKTRVTRVIDQTTLEVIPLDACAPTNT